MVRQRTKNARALKKTNGVLISNEQQFIHMDELKKKPPLNDINDENVDENLINLKVFHRINLSIEQNSVFCFVFQRLHDGYSTIIDKLGYGKFKPYLQRLFHSVEIMIKNEEIEFKKIDAKYQYVLENLSNEN